MYVQYGCGPFSSPEGWLNYDPSPTLKLQKLPIVGTILKKKMHVAFNDNILLGDIVKGLPDIKKDSCDGVYCSHVLEHLSFEDFKKAIVNTYSILKSGGIFRCLVPDLEWAARKYVQQLDKGANAANIEFLKETMLGKNDRPRGITQITQNLFGNTAHLFMWDNASLERELTNVGFSTVRKCHFNDSKDAMFKLVEDESRFVNAVTLEAIK